MEQGIGAYIRKIKYLLIITLAFLWMPSTILHASFTDSLYMNKWYAGFQGGVPFAVSTFSSFGTGKVHAGYDMGIYGGYRFSTILSFEAQAAWGNANMEARECCANYWLGADGNRYFVPVAGMNGHSYGKLKSCVALQRYGLQLNVNLLGFFRSMRQKRWMFEISPLLAAVGTKTSLENKDDENNIIKDNRCWHWGVGSSLQIGYHLTEHFAIDLYSSIIHLTGKNMDGIPKYLHKSNYLWENGLRICWSFGKHRNAKADRPAQSITIAQPPLICTETAAFQTNRGGKPLRISS